MSGLKYALVFVCVIVAALLSFAVASRYALHAPTAGNYVWPERPAHATILFGGDMMFDRSIRTAIEEHARKQDGLPAEASAQAGDFIFSCIDSVLQGADLVVANLEGPITEHASVSATSTPGDEFNYTFTFPPATAELLYAHNIRVVNVGNNHILNFGRTGLASTLEFLHNADVAYFGDPVHSGIAIGAIRGIPLEFINYNEFSAGGGSASGGAAASTTIAQIQKARAGGYIPIVYTHWGIEYATTSSAYSRELAHSFVDAGAEIVVGSHPHVVEESEAYKGKHIYYSLGNFIFDQYFSEDVQRGLLLQVTFGTGGVQTIKEIPIKLGHDRRTCAPV